MRQRNLICIIVFCMVGLCFSPVYAFTDIKDKHWASKMILEMEQNGNLIELTAADGSFSADSAITRGEFITVLVKALANGKQGILNMEDADSVSSEIKGYLGAAQEIGVFSGVMKDDKIYANADTLITRQEAATILGRFLKVTLDIPTEFTDSIEIAKYMRSYVSGMTAVGIINGYKDNNFRPKGNLTKAEAVSLISKSANYKKFDAINVDIYTGGMGFGYLDGNINEALYLNPIGVEIDNSGNLIIADNGNNLIRKVNGKEVNTIAGKIETRELTELALGLYKDGNAKEALFNRPVDMAVNSKGHLFVADSSNNCIRVIKDGNVYNFAGGGKAGFKEGSKNSAQFNLPSGIAIDKEDNLYVADTLNNCIRKIDKEQNVSVFAGVPEKAGYKDGSNNNALFLEPIGIAIDEKGVIYVADSGNQRIRKIEDGKVTTVAGSATAKDLETGYYKGGLVNGKALKAEFNFPNGISFGDNGMLYIADTNNNCIRGLTKDGNVITVAGCGAAGIDGGKPLLARFNGPTDVEYYNGVLYIADSLNSAVRIIKIK